MAPAPLIRRGVLILACALSAVGVRAASVPAGARVLFPDSIRAVPSGEPVTRPHRVREKLRAAELAAPINLVVSLRMRNFDELEARLQSREQIAPAEMEAKYLPDRADYERVAAWLAAQGFVQTVADPNHTNVCVRGTVAQASAAMAVSFARVATADGEFSSAIDAPSLPAAISAPVLGIEGLQPHRRMHIPRRSLQIAAVNSVGSYFTPADIVAAYNVPSSLTGTGQTIAIIIDAVPAAGDRDAFYSATTGAPGTASPMVVIPIAGGPLTASQQADIDEAALDTEWSAAMAPGAKLRLYAIETLDDSNLLAACTQILADEAKDPSIRQVSFSAGEIEDPSRRSTLRGYSQTFAQLAAANITFFVSSGDAGSNPDFSGQNNDYQSSSPLSVEYPASDTNVTSVGGTEVFFNFNWVADLSQAWSVSGSGSNGTGGGVSGVFSRPSWQTGSGFPVGTTRCVPDVAAIAIGFKQLTTGALIVANGQDTGVTGTSLSSPLWAGLTALMNQSRVSLGLQPLGLLGPWIYPLNGSAAFSDVVGGANGAYTAGVGYDLCTGLGEPNLAELNKRIDEEVTDIPAPSSPVNAGAAVTMSITPQLASTYQWQLNGASIPGATAATYRIASAQASDAGTYTVVLVNALGTNTYSLGTLAVNAPPQITVQPQPLTVNAGSGATFSVTAPGSGLTYQWRLNGVNVAGATSSTLTLANVQTANAGSYTVVVSNSFGPTTSAAAVLTVVGGPGAPSIATQPVSESITSGSTVVFSVAPAGTAAATYQWLFNGAALAGATGARLVVTGASSANAGGSYACLVTVAGAARVSDAAILALASTANPGRLINLSMLSNISGSLSMGFVIGGAGTSGKENLLIRAIGPAIGPGTLFNVGGIMPDPTLTVVEQSNNAVSFTNSGWGANQAAVTAADNATGAFGLNNPASKDSALVQSLPAVNGGYSATVAGASGDGGNALTEVYDDTANYTPASTRLINLSCLTAISSGSTIDVGFVIGGTTAKTVLIRASGPAIGPGTLFNVGGVMADPQIIVSASATPNNVIASNAGWAGDAVLTSVANSLGAFAYTDVNSKDSATIVTLEPGVPYAVQVNSASGGAGTVLVEIYEVP